MREFKEFDELSYHSLINSIKNFVKTLSDNRIIEVISMMYDPNTTSNRKYKAIIVIK